MALLATANIARSDQLAMRELVKKGATKSPDFMLPNFEGYFLREVKTPDEEGKTYGEGKKDIPLYLGDINENKDAFLSWLGNNVGNKILTKGNYDRKQVGNNEQRNESGQTDTEATAQSYIEQNMTIQKSIKMFKPYYLAKPIDELGI